MRTRLRWKIFLVVVAAFLAAQVQAQPRFTFDATPGQLGKDVVPSEYRLALDLDPAKETFAGLVDIALRVRRPVEAIVLNAFELTSKEIALTEPGAPRPMTATDDKTKRQWRIADGRTIEPGIYTLRIAYTGKVNNVGEGLFGVAYTAEDGPARMLATQLEPIAARSIFPGFDEPSFHASFAITVTAPSAYEVVSNMPVKSRDVQGAVTRWQFSPTPPMPSYLARQFLALTLGDKVPTQMVSRLPGMVAANYTHGAMTYAFTLDNFDALSRKTSEFGRPHLLAGAASGFNEAARATALIADQKRLLGDMGEKVAKETAAAIELKSRIRTRDSTSLAASLSRSTTGKR